MTSPREHPTGLPRTDDEGAASHLLGMTLPHVLLAATDGPPVDLAEVSSGRWVLFVYPRTGVPGEAEPVGWDDIPGAAGCTAEACGFRDNLQALYDAGASAVYGLSAQTTGYQREAALRLHLPYPLLSDSELTLMADPGFPSFRVGALTLFTRLTLIVSGTTIEQVLYPEYPTGQHAERVAEWLRENPVGGAPGPLRELTERVREFVAGVEEAIPGLLVAVHLTGSGAAGDWQHDSDIDLVFESSRAVTDADVAALVGLHASTAGGHCVDGIYLTAGQIASGPDGIRSAPQAVSGEFALHRSDGQLTWVTWLEMRQGHTARVESGRLGPWTARSPGLEGGSDASERARAASRENLRSYWLPYATETVERLTARSDDDAVPADAIEWLALGAQRLVVTMETGRAVSKSEAAEFAARRWPAYAELLTRVLASRRGASAQFPVGDARLSVALVLDCVAVAG